MASPPVSPSIYPRGVAPEFHVLDSDILQAALNEATLMVDGPTWGSLTCPARLAYAAHLLACRYPNAAQGSAAEGTGGAGLRSAGDVTSVRTGDLSVTYGKPASEEDLSSTAYGRRFKALQARTAASRSPRWVGVL